MVGGKPLVAWTIELALRTTLIDSVVVSTDDPAILTLARGYHDDMPLTRPAELAQDDTPMLPVIRHAVSELEQRGQSVGVIVLLQPTSPLRSEADIRACIQPVLDGQARAATTVCEAEHNPYFSMGRIVDRRWQPLFPEHAVLGRRQDAPVIYRETGSVFAFERDLIMVDGDLFPPSTAPVVVPADRSIDIDSPIDLKLVDLLLR